MDRVAIDFSLDAFDHGVKGLKGRHVAGRDFLRAYLKYGRAARVDAVAADPAVGGRFLDLVRGMGTRRYGVVPSERFDLLDGAVAMVGDPALETFAWERRRFGVSLSVIGVTHALCSRAAMEALGGLVTAPVEEWDALVCTSPSARAVVTGVMEGHREYLRERFGSGLVMPKEPMLPVIPFGVDCEAMAGVVSAQGRVEWRARMGIGEDESVVLFVGRLSFHAKAHPMPLLMACERAGRAMGRRLVLVLAGQFANESVQRALQELCRTVSPGVRVMFMDGAREESPRDLWQVADVFCSLVDNVQETFGLSVVEAMAAGLPCVVADWDGYRALVRDGEEGFLVETLMASGEGGSFVATRYAQEADDYDRFVGHVSQSVAVNIEAAAAALARLLSDEALRRSMGERARARARAAFDWRGIVSAYDDLFAESASRRAASGRAEGGRSVPLGGNPFDVFAGYATRRLGDDDWVEVTGGWTLADVERVRGMAANSFGMAANPVSVSRAWGVLAEAGRCRVGSILERVDGDSRFLVGMSLVWLMKAGFVRMSRRASGEGGAGAGGR